MTLVIHLNQVPILDGTLQLASDGVIPGGSKENHKWLDKDVDYQDITLEEQLILCDSITSGGLLIALDL